MKTQSTKCVLFLLRKKIVIQSVSDKRHFRCINCFLLLVYTINLSLKYSFGRPATDGNLVYETCVTNRPMIDLLQLQLPPCVASTLVISSTHVQFCTFTPPMLLESVHTVCCRYGVHNNNHGICLELIFRL